ncbi:uncharacterized protein LOC135374016 [Ornithodoros turicata]|uniref:uncharacterized protein LOC135374016 n=1 Tax=Ornithodoros turicata TaxID=34597 RepID=UPI0031397D8D
METLLPAFPKFDPHTDASSLAQRWTKRHARFENFLLAANVTDPTRKRAMLLHYAGEEVYDIFQTLPDTQSDYDTAVARLKAHFTPKKNTVYEKHVFRQAKQDTGETLDQFQVRLRRLAATCEFANIDKELVSQIIEGTASHGLRRAALRDTDITLDKLLGIGRSLKIAKLQASNIEGPPQHQTIQKVAMNKPWRGGATRKENRFNHRSSQKCFGCGGNWPHKNGKASCPARGATCHVPKEEPLRQLVQEHSEEQRSATKLPVVTVSINQTPLEFFLDTGAGVNVVGERTWRKRLGTPLKATTTRLVPYGVTQEIPVMGAFTASFSFKDSNVEAPVYVVGGPQASLSSYRTAMELRLINIVQTIAQETSVSIRKEFPKLFGGLGRLKNFQVSLEISKEVRPVARQHRRIPLS